VIKLVAVVAPLVAVVEVLNLLKNLCFFITATSATSATTVLRNGQNRVFLVYRTVYIALFRGFIENIDAVDAVVALGENSTFVYWTVNRIYFINK